MESASPVVQETQVAPTPAFTSECDDLRCTETIQTETVWVFEVDSDRESQYDGCSFPLFVFAPVEEPEDLSAVTERSGGEYPPAYAFARSLDRPLVGEKKLVPAGDRLLFNIYSDVNEVESFQEALHAVQLHRKVNGVTEASRLLVFRHQFE